MSSSVLLRPVDVVDHRNILRQDRDGSNDNLLMISASHDESCHGSPRGRSTAGAT
jgi:hypothetical protein